MTVYVLFLLVLFPNVIASLGDRIFPEDNFKFFFEVLTDLQKQRANSPEVYTFAQFFFSNEF